MRMGWLAVLTALMGAPVFGAAPEPEARVAVAAGTYSVYYRKDSDEPWLKYGDYKSADDAYEAAWQLEERGYETFVKFKAS